MRRVYGYCRVSGAEQGRHGTSLGAQQDDIRRYCKAHGHRKPTLLVEVESAAAEKIERRVVLQGLIDDLRDGDLVLVTRLDRWSRDIVQAVQSVRALVARGVTWIAIQDGIDATTSQGDSTLGIMSWVADQERKRIYERTVLRRKALRDEGRYVEGLPPVGYERGPGNILVPNADAGAARALFRLCADGRSLRELSVEMEERFGIRRDKQGWWRALRNRVYLGEVQSSGGAWMSAHEPIVDRALFAMAQEQLRARRLGGGRSHSDDAHTATWLLRGLASCALCGSRMGSAYGGTRDPSRRGHDYYACRSKLERRGCDARYVRVDASDAGVSALVLDRLADLRHLLSATKPRARDAPDFAAMRAAREARRKRVLDSLEFGTMHAGEIRERLDRIDAELLDIDRREAAYRARSAAGTPAVRREALGHVQELERAWSQSEPAARRDIIGQLVRSVRLRTGHDPAVEWKPVPDLVAEIVQD